MRNEECVDDATAEHRTDGIAGRERKLYLENTAENRRKNEQERGKVAALGVHVRRLVDSGCDEKTRDEEREILAVKKQVYAWACRVETVFADVKNGLGLEVHPEQHELENHESYCKDLCGNRLAAPHVDEIQNVVEPNEGRYCCGRMENR